MNTNEKTYLKRLRVHRWLNGLVWLGVYSCFALGLWDLASATAGYLLISGNVLIIAVISQWVFTGGACPRCGNEFDSSRVRDWNCSLRTLRVFIPVFSIRLRCESCGFGPE